MSDPESVLETLGKIYKEFKAKGERIKIKFSRPEAEEDHHIEFLFDAGHIEWYDKNMDIISLTSDGKEFFEELDKPEISTRFSKLAKEGLTYIQIADCISNANSRRNNHGWMST